MATQDHTIAGSGYGNAYLDSLIWGASGWTLGSGAITYYFGSAAEAAAQSPAPQGTIFSDWTPAEIAAFERALRTYSDVCGLKFQRATSLAGANLVEWQNNSDAYLGRHEVPTGAYTHNGNANQVWGYFAVNNADGTANPDFASFDPGSVAYKVMIHELGHAMGLAHPHDGGNQSDRTRFPGVDLSSSAGEDAQNQGPFTVMSYLSGLDVAPRPGNTFGDSASLGAFDIAALQRLYGTNTATATGADTYTMPTANQAGTSWSCIWDAGGIDTIDNSAATTASTIDLRAAPLTGPNAGGYASYNAGIQGGLTIANGVTIENAKGGSGADTINGNDAGNSLQGNAGNDVLTGGGGTDTLQGGADDDRLFGDGKPAGPDPGPSGVGMGSGTITKASGAGNIGRSTALDVTNAFSLAANADILDATVTPHVTIHGTADGHRDVYKLNLKAGSTITLDTDHTAGFDSVVLLVDTNGRRITVDDDSATSEGASGSTTVSDSFLSYTTKYTGTFYVFVAQYSEDDDDTVIDAGATYDLQISVADPKPAPAIGSGSGNDTLDGGTGSDTLDGGAGNDSYIVDNAGDRVVEAAGRGADRVFASVGYALAAGQEVETLATTSAAGTAAINLTGNEFVQAIVGNAGANRLDGKGGADTMTGLAGNDIYTIDNVGDRVVEAAGGGTDDRAVASVSYTLAAGQSVEVLGTTSAAGTAAINLTGNELAQTVIGNAGINRLDGKGGVDTLQGLSGNDLYVIDNAGDRVIEAAGGGTDDRVVASVSYALAAGQQVEVLGTTSSAGTGAINLTGNELAQTVIGNAGANSLDGKGGTDTLQGLSGNDAYGVDAAGDTVIESADAGTDTVYASITYTLTSNVENLRLTGSSNIGGVGNASANAITGNGVGNTLNGLAGLDTLTGGGGGDYFYFSTAPASANLDHVVDFASAEGDRILLNQAVFAGVSALPHEDGEFGGLRPEEFVVVNSASTTVGAEDRIVYVPGTGALYYDWNGGTSANRVQFAVLDNHAGLGSADFLVA